MQIVSYKSFIVKPPLKQNFYKGKILTEMTKIPHPREFTNKSV